jgi:ABC-type nickel/cobalt efflux system permease component RcnA
MPSAKTPRRTAVLLLFLLCAPFRLHSHPHIFINCRLTIVFDENGLAGFELSWVFDRMFSAAVVPCPGALLILLFCLSLDVLPMGILLALLMAAGMGISISVVGSAAIAMRGAFTRLVPQGSRVRRIVQGGLELPGSLLICCLGVFLLLGS